MSCSSFPLQQGNSGTRISSFPLQQGNSGTRFSSKPVRVISGPVLSRSGRLGTLRVLQERTGPRCNILGFLSSPIKGEQRSHDVPNGDHGSILRSCRIPLRNTPDPNGQGLPPFPSNRGRGECGFNQESIILHRESYPGVCQSPRAPCPPVSFRLFL